MSTITPIPVRRVAVYELMNRNRLESLLVITNESEKSLLGLLRREPPVEALRWNVLDDLIKVESLANFLREDAAEQFVLAYMKNMSHRTWRFRVWRP